MEILTRIEVKRLFGYLDQDIPLSTDTGITILHGANGSGKTTILRCLAEVSKQDWRGLCDRPFEKLLLHFASATRFEFTVDPKDLGVVTLTRRGKKAQTWSIREGLPQEWAKMAERGRGFRGYLEREDPELFATLGQMEIQNLYLRRLWHMQHDRAHELIAPDWLNEFCDQFRCTLIEEQRLFRLEKERDQAAPRLTRVVAEFSQRVVETIKEVHRQYGARSQHLDRTFPRRMVEVLAQDPPDTASLEAKYNDLERTRRDLQSADLLDPETGMMRLDPSSITRSDVRKILSLYADDMKDKLSIFDKLYKKITLFESLLQDYFAHKTVRVTRKGIEITVADTGSRLEATDLSSGEQHIFVLFFVLIFQESGDHRLVLIDEPELSLHPRWQLRFIDDLERIRGVSNVAFILASHSPLMFQGHMGMARDLRI